MNDTLRFKLSQDGYYYYLVANSQGVRAYDGNDEPIKLFELTKTGITPELRFVLEDIQYMLQRGERTLGETGRSAEEMVRKLCPNFKVHWLS